MHVCVQVIDGFSTKRLHDPPEQGKLAPDDNKSELWQERVVNTLLDPKTAQEFLQPGVKVWTCTSIYSTPYVVLPAIRPPTAHAPSGTPTRSTCTDTHRRMYPRSQPSLDMICVRV